MFRIGIIGAENSHAVAFSDLFNTPDENGAYRWPGYTVTAIGGHYPEENKKVYDRFGLALLAEKPEDMLGQVDAVMITTRDGKFHLEMAKPFIEANIPLFIDKPVTVSAEDALALACLAKEKGVPVCGGSTVKLAPAVEELASSVRGEKRVRGGTMTAPLKMENPYSGFYFYAPHLAEASFAVFGYDVKTVTAKRVNNDVTVIAEYDDFAVTQHFLDGNYLYHGAVYLDGDYVERKIDLSECYQRECNRFVHMLQTGEMPQPWEELIASVFYLEAVEKSFANGGVTVEVVMPAL